MSAPTTNFNVTSASRLEHTYPDGRRETYFKAWVMNGSVISICNNRGGIWQTAGLPVRYDVVEKIETFVAALPKHVAV